MTATTNPNEEAILAAARELIARRGPTGAKDEATARVTALERQANWPEHALALRILTAVERLLDPPAA